MKIFVVSKDSVERLGRRLWERLDGGSHPDLGRIEKRLAGFKPALLTKGGEGDVLVFHVNSGKRRIFYCDEIQPKIVEMSESGFKSLEKSSGRTAAALMQAGAGLPRVVPHKHRCG